MAFLGVTYGLGWKMEDIAKGDAAIADAAAV